MHFEEFVETVNFEVPESGIPLELERVVFCDSFLDTFGDLVDSQTINQ